MAERSAQVRLAPSPESAARARRFVAGTLAAWQVLAGAAETAVLLTSELVTNALRYSQGSVDVHVDVDEQPPTVRIYVHDTDPRVPQPLAVPAEAENGRGLWLVAALADRWGADQLPGGKQVWFELAAA